MLNPYLPGDQQEIRICVDESRMARFPDEGLVHPLYSTFALAQDAEWVCRRFVVLMKEEHEEGVGSRVSVVHRSPCPLGAEVRLVATLVEVIDNRVLCSWQAFASDNSPDKSPDKPTGKSTERLIAEGEQEQHILNRERFGKLIDRLAEGIIERQPHPGIADKSNSEWQAHPSAIVDAGAKIGSGTRIWHFCHVMSGAVIGERCVLGQNVFVASGVHLGNGSKVQNNVSLYEGVVCEEEVFIGPSAVFTNVVNPRAAVIRRDEFKTTHIERGASLGANCTIICGVRIGAYAFVGAGAVVTADVLPFALVMGVPARQSGWMSAAGHRLHFDTEAQALCPTGARYRLRDGRVEVGG